MIGLNYDSRFYGHDLMTTKMQRAFIASYQYLGLVKPDSLIVLKPQNGVVSYKTDGKTFIKNEVVNNDLLQEAIAYFQNASHWRDFSVSID